MGVGRGEGGDWVGLMELKSGDLEGENYKKQYSEREHYQYWFRGTSFFLEKTN